MVKENQREPNRVSGLAPDFYGDMLMPIKISLIRIWFTRKKDMKTSHKIKLMRLQKPSLTKFLNFYCASENDLRLIF